MKRICEVCGEEFERDNARYFPLRFCSYKCYEEWTRFNKSPNCKCEVCGKDMYLKPHRLNRLKHSGITCSNKCEKEYRSKWMTGEGNHQFGLKGPLNSSFTNNPDKIIYQGGYAYIYDPTHPKAGKSGRINLCEFVVEQNWKNSLLNVLMLSMVSIL